MRVTFLVLFIFCPPLPEKFYQEHPKVSETFGKHRELRLRSAV